MVRSILLIDDDADEIDILNEAVEMEGSGSTCDWAEGAEMAYGVLRVTRPDLILLDYNMPGPNGLICLEEIKKRKELQHIPVIIYSTCIDYSLQQEAISKGAFRCIQKPTSVYDLVKELKNLFTQV
ncbi:response regulator [Chitinophaga sp. CF418]|uniref:response regulator n=1 Tax=Chitinophaga sp. CF418 TaxID=1855287 RepID=UPI0009165906|nr:response regulator [Chitinophaga sp. CF418]SHN30156.1 Response regulator receiver domain-containing protein [Chitinophaga sp. CF418]